MELNHAYFSTPDKDNDGSSKNNCSKDYRGGFWYKNCITGWPATGYHFAEAKMAIREAIPNH